jgi:hypothetical protein
MVCISTLSSVMPSLTFSVSNRKKTTSYIMQSALYLTAVYTVLDVPVSTAGTRSLELLVYAALSNKCMRSYRITTETTAQEPSTTSLLVYEALAY